MALVEGWERLGITLARAVLREVQQAVAGLPRESAQRQVEPDLGRVVHQVLAVVAGRAILGFRRQHLAGGEVLSMTRGTGRIFVLRAGAGRPRGIGDDVRRVESEILVTVGTRLVDVYPILFTQDGAGHVRVGLDHLRLRVALRTVLRKRRVRPRDRPGIHEILGCLQVIVGRHGGDARDERERRNRKTQAAPGVRLVVVIQVALETFGYLLLCASESSHGMNGRGKRSLTLRSMKRGGGCVGQYRNKSTTACQPVRMISRKLAGMWTSSQLCKVLW